jgi:glycosyltransferase involved in cell wall biosynthesis
MKNLKITFLSLVFPYPNRGASPGVERSIEEISINLRKLGHNVKIVTTYLNGGTRKDYYKGLEILRLKESKYYFGRLGSLLEINRIIFGLNALRPKNFKFYKDSDIIIMYNPGLCTRLFTIKKIPIISMFWHFTIVFYFITQWDFKNNRNIITVSKKSKADLIKYYGTKEEWIKIIPNGINSKKFNPSNKSKEIRKKYGNNILLFSGLMVPRKRVPVLLKAICYVLQEIPDVHLILTGYGPFLEAYKKLSYSLDIQNNVNFLGFIKDELLVKYYATSDIFVFPSELEGFGQILLEAMASGTPVICVNKPPMSNIIENGGITFKVNDPKDLSIKIIELLKNREKLNELSKNALNIAKKYDYKIIARKYHNYFLKILKQKLKNYYNK